MSDMDARMAQLRARFRARAGEEEARLRAALAGADLAEIRRLAHGLHGSAGVFGFPKLGEDAAMVESAIDHGQGAQAIQILCEQLLERLAEVAQRG